MSELKDILTQPQRIKHHEVLQYLCSHPNMEYSIAQLDYLLPRGAALQRFPGEWFRFMGRGGCGNRNIELVIETEEQVTRELSSSSLPSLRPPANKTFLICRRPELHTMKELQQLIRTPATMPDLEECVGLHTDRIIISSHLLRECQRTGLVFYFPDKYVKKETINIPAKSACGALDTSAQLSALVATGAESSFNQRQLLSEISGVATATVLLPLGVRVRHKLFTWRGVAFTKTHCLPVCLHLQERLLVTFDNENAVLRQTSGTKDGLLVRWRIVMPGACSSASMNPTARGNPEPLNIRARSVMSHKITPVSRLTPSDTANIDSSRYASRSGEKIQYTKVQMDIEAVRSASTFKLIFTVNEEECVVNMEVVDVDTSLPGVLIGREWESSNFSLPSTYRLMDPGLFSMSIKPLQPPSINTNQKDRNPDKQSGVVETEARVSAPSEAFSRLKSLDNPTCGLLSWWQNSSPLVLGVREGAYPLEAAVSAATELVYAKRALLHEAQLRTVRHTIRKKTEGERQSFSAGREGRRVRRKQELRNRHMLHFGLDASVPFSPKSNEV